MPYPGMASVAVGNPQAVGITSGDRQRQWRHPCGIRSLRWPFAFLNLNAAPLFGDKHVAHARGRPLFGDKHVDINHRIHLAVARHLAAEWQPKASATFSTTVHLYQARPKGGPDDLCVACTVADAQSI
eukprot:s2013_g21.t1